MTSPAVSRPPPIGAMYLLWALILGIVGSSTALSILPNIACKDVDGIAQFVPMLRYNLTLLPNPDTQQLPTVLAEALLGYNLPGQQNVTVAYHAINFAMYPHELTKEGHHCLYATRWSMELVDNVTEYNLPVAQLDFDIRQVSGRNDQQEEIIARLLSEGFRKVHLEANWTFPTHVLFGDVSCSDCALHMSFLRYNFHVDFLTLYVQNSWRVDLASYTQNIANIKDLLADLSRGSHITELIIRDSQLIEDPGVLYPYLPSLRVLELTRIGLTKFVNENFRRVPNLEHVYLGGNKFSVIPRGLRSLTHLKSLDVSDNPVSKEELHDALVPLRELRWLNISGIPLDDLAVIHSTDIIMDHLEVLDMSWCNLSNLADANAFFSRHKQLKVVSLAGNPLRSIPADSFNSLPFLKELDLSDMELKSGPSLDIPPEASLDFVSLARNQLVKPEWVLDPSSQTKIENVDFSGNKMGKWNSRVHLSYVSNLNLSYCGLYELTSKMRSALEELSSVDLGGNDFNCSSCRTKPVQTWLASNKSVKVFSLGTLNNITCAYPVDQRNVSILDANLKACTLWDELKDFQKFLLYFGIAMIIFVSLYVFMRVGYPRITLLLSMRASKRRVQKNVLSNVFEFRVFICYSSSTREWTKELLHYLRAQSPSLCYCLHEVDFTLGSRLFPENSDYIRISHHILVVVTRKFVKKHWAKWYKQLSAHSIPGEARNHLILLEMEPLDAVSLPLTLGMVKEAGTYIQWPQERTVATERRAFQQLIEIIRGDYTGITNVPQPGPSGQYEPQPGPSGTLDPQPGPSGIKGHLPESSSESRPETTETKEPVLESSSDPRLETLQTKQPPPDPSLELRPEAKQPLPGPSSESQSESSGIEDP